MSNNQTQLKPDNTLSSEALATETLKPLFVFGTLKNPDVFQSVAKIKPEYHVASLPNFVKVGLNILESEGDIVDGYIVYVDAVTMTFLDRYEGIDSNFYKKIKVEAVHDNGEIETCTAYQLTND